VGAVDRRLHRLQFTFLAPGADTANELARLLAALGIAISEKSGVVNLGIEGIMLIAAVAGFGAAHATGVAEFGFIAGAAAGAALALLFAALTLGLLTNQYATGLALALFGAGLSAFLGQSFQGESLAARGADGIPRLREIPIVGPALFAQHWLVYFALLLVVVVACFLYRTRAGLVLLSV
jgi:simple sugar transport system permease protein